MGKLSFDTINEGGWFCIGWKGTLVNLAVGYGWLVVFCIGVSENDKRLYSLNIGLLSFSHWLADVSIRWN